MTDDDDDSKIFSAKCKYFFDKEIAVHIKKKDSEWFNGTIEEWTVNYIILDEFKKGPTGPIFYSEMERCEMYQFPS